MKRWTVEESNWGGGRMRQFWFKRNAIVYSEQSSYPFVDLKDEFTGKKIRIKDSDKRLIMSQPGNYNSIIGWV